MSVWSVLFGTSRGAEGSSSALPLVSGFADSSMLQGIAAAEAAGLAEYASMERVLSREKALEVSAVDRAIGIVTAPFWRMPLRALNVDGPVANQPTFLYRSDTGVSAQERIVRTVDSLAFHGEALWVVSRGTKQPDQAHAPILDAGWVPHDRWEREPSGRITVNKQPVDSEQIIYFHTGRPGVLKLGYNDIMAAVQLDKARNDRAANPIPLLEFGPTDPNSPPLTLDEIRAAKAQIRTERERDGQAVFYRPGGYELVDHGGSETDFFEAGRNANRIDIAGHFQLPASLIDGSVAQASLTYQTTEGNANRFVTETLPHYMGPIEAALSMDNVVPRGQRVRFDMSEILTAPGTPTGAVEED